MYCVGLTGSIASGKSTVSEYLRKKGIAVHSADAIARELTMPGQLAWKEMKKHFGDAVITATGELDRAHIREIIFASAVERRWLENLLHPLIRETIWQRLLSTQGSAYQVIEIPLLIGKENYPYLDRVLLIASDPEKQINRVMKRDKLSREAALSILKTQPNYLEEKNLVDDIVFNDGSVEELLKKVEVLHKKYLALSIL